MIIVPWEPALTRDELEARANPSFANQPECVPWQLYDTQDVVTGQVNPSVFFANINADKTLSNMEGPGQLSEPQYFIVSYVAADFLVAPSLIAAANEPGGPHVAIENILKTCRATFEFNMSNKRYGPFSLSMCAATGGATGFAYGYGTAAAGNAVGAANNGNVGSGGFPISGAITIPPKIGFDLTVRYGVATTLAATLKLRMSLVGVLYRRVL